MRRFLYPAQRLHSWLLVLCVLGVGDEHCRPLLKLEVREAQQIVVKGQNPVPAERRDRTVPNGSKTGIVSLIALRRTPAIVHPVAQLQLQGALGMTAVKDGHQATQRVQVAAQICNGGPEHRRNSIRTDLSATTEMIPEKQNEEAPSRATGK